MVLTANVKGGEAPYTYTWTIYFWDRSEVLSTSSTCELYGSSAFANATLEVEVKDSTGKKVTSSAITVKVTGIVN